MTLEFLRTGYLLLLVPVLPLVLALWFGSYRAALHARGQYAEQPLLKRSRRLSHRGQLFVLACWLISATLLVVAAAGPVISRAPRTVKAGSMQVVVVFDVSRSMAAEDYRDLIPEQRRIRYAGKHGSRLDMAKYLVETGIMDALNSNQVGFVNYKGAGFSQAPLTDDHASLTFVLRSWVKIENAPGNGSDYALGLLTALDTFQRRPQPGAQKVIVLFSDGGFTGKPELLRQVIERLRAENVRLVVLGLGSQTPEKIPQYDSNGARVGYVTDGNTPVTSHLEEAPLLELARAAGGSYSRVTAGTLSLNWPTALAGREKVQDEQVDIFQIPLLLCMAIMLWLAALGLDKDVFKQRPVVIASLLRRIAERRRSRDHP